MMMANFVLSIICLQINPRGAGSQKITIQSGVTKITPKCNETFKKLCLKSPDSEKGPLIKINLNFPWCQLTCNYVLSTGGWHATSMWLPDNLPCEYGRVCKNGTCIQDVC
uniref:Putative salp15 n=1 Tax=Ixodes ricinus TaxID=34613 RepID=A0A0K8RCE2_IXORI